MALVLLQSANFRAAAQWKYSRRQADILFNQHSRKIKKVKNRLQTKDIPTEPVLEFLAGLRGAPAAWWKSEGIPTVASVFPGIPEKLLLAKMRSLLKRQFVEGCACGCRGDFVITEKGREFLGE